MKIEWTFEQGRIFSCDEHGELIAEATYCDKTNGDIDVNHTYVVPKLRGQGIAGELMTAVAAFVREKKVKMTASCSYAHAWLQRHQQEYADIISTDLNGQAPACRLDGRK